MNIRPYRKEDEEAIREICCDTGNAGRPIDGIFPDRKLFADYWTSYYLHHEPEASFVAEERGHVRGYVLACLDETRRRRILLTRIVPIMIADMFCRSMLLNKRAWSLVFGAVCPKRPSSVEKIFERPADAGHLHVNLAPGFHRQGIGSDLMDALERYAYNHGTMALCAETREDNKNARVFFELRGYKPQERRVGYKVRGQAFNVVVLVKLLGLKR